MNEHIEIDKQLARQSFDKAADSYDEAAVLQKEVASRLLERLDLLNAFSPKTILDVGAGTGFCSLALQKKYPKAKLFALDFSEAMLNKVRKKQSLKRKLSNSVSCIAGDAEALPLKSNSIDLLVSSLTIQWVNDLEATFKEFLRVLAPGGLLLFTSFGAETLKELRYSWSLVDKNTHVNQFMDMHNMGDVLLKSGLSDPVVDADYFVLTYSTVKTLMQDLKQIGAHNVTQKRQRGLMGKQHFESFAQAYEPFRQDGVLPATYEVIYGHAWAAEDKENNTGQVCVPVSTIS